MTASPSEQPAAPASFDAAETFLGVVWRRARYVLAIALSAVVFSWLGWSIAAPHPDWAGFSLVIWQSQSILSALLLALLLLGVTAVCSLIVHPDNPHMGLFCSLAGMAALSIRGGSVHLLMVYGQIHGNLKHLSDCMALECLEWGGVILLADLFARMLHDKLLTNDQWLLRTEQEMGRRIKAKERVGSAAGVSKMLSHFFHTDRITGAVRIPLAMVWLGVIAFGLLYVLMQSQLKGQVLMACFVAFYAATICTYFAFPTVPFWAPILAVPLTGAVCYLVGRDAVPVYPGHAPYFAMRALPIDYLTAGVPGAILGLYYSLGWALNSDE